MNDIKELYYKIQKEIIPTSPFHFDSTVYKPGHFPTSDTKWESGKRWQTMLWRGETLGLILENVGNIEKPKILLYIYSDKLLQNEFLDSVVQEIEYRYNLKLDIEDFYNNFPHDSFLTPVIQKFRGLRPMNPGGLYEYLIIAIVLQNTVVRRSVSMMQTLFEKYGTILQFDNKEFYCFWEPHVLAQTAESELRDLKVGYRAKSLNKVSEAFADDSQKELELRNKSQEEQKNALLSLYGIGPASVGYIMFDVFHHLDLLTHISPWEQKIYTKLFFHKDYHKEVIPVEKMIKFFNKQYGKYKALAVNYVWEDIWWKRKKENIPWLEELIRL